MHFWGSVEQVISLVQPFVVMHLALARQLEIYST